LDERLGLGDLIAEHLSDSRRGKNPQLPLADLFRQSVYSRVAGYEDVNDAERLSQDPGFRLIGSEKVWDRGAALTSRLRLAVRRKKATCEIKEGRLGVD
jgi:DDE family transposase